MAGVGSVTVTLPTTMTVVITPSFAGSLDPRDLRVVTQAYDGPKSSPALANKPIISGPPTIATIVQLPVTSKQAVVVNPLSGTKDIAITGMGFGNMASAFAVSFDGGVTTVSVPVTLTSPTAMSIQISPSFAPQGQPTPRDFRLMVGVSAWSAPISQPFQPIFTSKGQ